VGETGREGNGWDLPGSEVKVISRWKGDVYRAEVGCCAKHNESPTYITGRVRLGR